MEDMNNGLVGATETTEETFEESVENMSEELKTENPKLDPAQTNLDSPLKIFYNHCRINEQNKLANRGTIIVKFLQEKNIIEGDQVTEKVIAGNPLLSTMDAIMKSETSKSIHFAEEEFKQFLEACYQEAIFRIKKLKI